MNRPACIPAVVAFIAILFSGCSGESVPETTLDRIYTSEQAQQGANLFESLCARCHSIQEFTGQSYDTIWAGTPLAALYVRIANTMPLDQPGSLSSNQTLALTAHILSSNGMPAGDVPLAADLDILTSILVAERQN